MNTSPSLVRIFAHEARCEFLKLLRLPVFIVPTVTFPVLFYVLFGLVMGPGDGVDDVRRSAYMLATYGAFGVIGTSLFALGAGVAAERGQGWMLLKRATPMPPVVHFLARMVVAAAMSLLVVGILMAVAWLFGGVRLPPATWGALAGALVAGSVPFSLFGLALGYLAGPNSAPAIVNLIYLPMAFASGLWVPIFALPEFFQQLAPWLLPYHYSQLALRTLGAAREEQVASSVVFLAIASLAFLALALWGYRRDQGVTYG